MTFIGVTFSAYRAWLTAFFFCSGADDFDLELMPEG
jgi:hypothetical protein